MTKLKLKLKDNVKGKTFFIKTKIGSEAFFDGTINYTQEQLHKYFHTQTYKHLIEEDLFITEETIGEQVEDFKLTYVNTIKQTPIEEVEVEEEDVLDYTEMSLKELRLQFPDIIASSKVKFLELLDIELNK